MRRILVIATATFVLASTTATADVRLGVRRDGTKYIYNVGGSSRGGGAVDYNWLARQRNRSTAFDAMIEKYSRKHGIDPVLVKAVIQVESNFDPACVSHKGARGLMQLMPATARRFNVTEVHDPEQNIRGGVTYLAHLLRYFSHDIPRALAAYNAGENAVLRYGGIPPYAETETYVKKALTVYYGRPYGGAVGGATYYAGNRSRSTLRGGFKQATKPFAVAAAVVTPLNLEGVRVLNSK